MYKTKSPHFTYFVQELLDSSEVTENNNKVVNQLQQHQQQLQQQQQQLQQQYQQQQATQSMDQFDYKKVRLLNKID